MARDDVEELRAPLEGIALELDGDVGLLPVLAHALVPDLRGHGDEVDDAAVVALGADGELDDRRHCVEPVLDHRDGAVEVRADAVHLVDEADAGDAVAVRLAPHGLGLRLDAGDGVEHRDGAVEHAQRPLDLDREVDVAGRVDDVDAVVVPLARRGRRGDRDAALLLLDHVVHHRGAFVHLADLVGLARVVEDALGRRGLARVDVRHDPDVAGLFEGELSLLWHLRFSSSWGVTWHDRALRPGRQCTGAAPGSCRGSTSGSG